MMIRTILKLVFVALLANATWHAFGAFSPHYKFKDGVEYAALHRGQMTDDAVREKILELAAQFDVPVTDADVAVTGQDRRTIIDVSYVRRIDLAPGFTYPWTFSIHVDMLSLPSLK